MVDSIHARPLLDDGQQGHGRGGNVQVVGKVLGGGAVAKQGTGEVEHRIRVTRNVPTFAGNLKAGEELVVTVVNARRPGNQTNTICMLPPDAFEFVVPGSAAPVVEAVDEVDPLAGLGFSL